MSCLKAIEGLHNRSTMEGCRSAVVVKFADSDKDKFAKRTGFGTLIF